VACEDPRWRLLDVFESDVSKIFTNEFANKAAV
jgi:hypothetical protein